MKKTFKTVFGGAMTMQALPMLRASGRTPAALSRTATGFVGIGVAGAMAGPAFEMVKAPYRMGLSNKKKKIYRR